MNHRMAFVRVTFSAGLNTRLAADASRSVNEETHVRWDWHRNNRGATALLTYQVSVICSLNLHRANLVLRNL